MFPTAPLFPMAPSTPFVSRDFPDSNVFPWLFCVPEFLFPWIPVCCFYCVVGHVNHVSRSSFCFLFSLCKDEHRIFCMRVSIVTFTGSEEWEWETGEAWETWEGKGRHWDINNKGVVWDKGHLESIGRRNKEIICIYMHEASTFLQAIWLV